MYNFDWQTFWTYLWPVTAFQNPLLRNGLIVTICVSILAQAAGVILGLIAALGRMSKFSILRWASGAYILYFRGTPLLVQMMLLYFGLGVMHIYDFPDIQTGFFTVSGAIQAGLLALAVNEGAYMAEIVRAGIDSIDPGQSEAAKSLGMTPGQAMRRIILPQAVKVIIPPTGNEFNNMMKTTSIMVVISAGELFFAFTQINARIFKPFELFIAASFYYLALTSIWSLIQKRLEKSTEWGYSSSKVSAVDNAGSKRVRTPGPFDRLVRGH
jgi:polar amino acid transport system permease protein